MRQRTLPASAPSLLTKSHLLGELRSGRRVVRRHHGVVRRKAPFLPVLLWCHVVLGPQVPLERLELLSVLQTNNVVGGYGFLDCDRRLRSIARKFAAGARYPGQCRVHLIDESRYLRRRYGVVANVCGDDVRRQPDEVVGSRIFSHGFDVPSLGFLTSRSKIRHANFTNVRGTDL